MVTAIVGANWGDEGKGKITDIVAEEADVVVRFQGGSNAGHTIINDQGKFALHQLPSGIFHEHIDNVIANGVALNIEYLEEELRAVRRAGIRPRLKISDRAHVLMEQHVLRDRYEEERLGAKRFGSTKSGIAPLYADKYAKTGIMVWELYSDGLMESVQSICEKQNVLFEHLYHKPKLDAAKMYEQLRRQGELIEENVCDTMDFLQNAQKKNKRILLEGQLGALKDVEHGIYPYVTSSSTLAGYAATGAGLAPYDIKDILAVTKAYSSAVGEGPFVSEIFGAEAEELRRRGGDAGEYGATTGRPRRVGYFDAVATRYGCRAQNATRVALTCLDVLGYMEEIPVCVAYDLDGEISDAFPNTEKLYRAKPVLEMLPGWGCDIRGIERFAELPENAKSYVLFLEEQIGFPITMVSHGPKRSEILMRHSG